jgi:hypothetical protein
MAFPALLRLEALRSTGQVIDGLNKAPLDLPIAAGEFQEDGEAVG